MIHAIATQYPKFLSLEIVYPDKRAHKFDTIKGGTADQRVTRATGRLKVECRDYILEKLTAWLRQRKHALKGHPNLMKAAQLIVLLHVYDKKGYNDLCEFVAKHAEVFRDLSPADPGHYEYFQNTIQKILSYCSKEVQQGFKK